MTALLKSRASSLTKLAQLPKYRHPADLINEFEKPMLQQNKLINGQLQFGKNLYGSAGYQALVKSVVSLRRKYRSSSLNERKTMASQQIGAWNSYLQIKHSQLPQQYRINETQKQRIYQTLIITKQRNQERLALNRFISFFNQYSKGFKLDIQLHPLVMMKLTYPHWGYLNLFPSVPAYRLRLQQIFDFFEQLTVASLQRQQGNSLHSSEILSFIFWKLYTRKFSLQQPSPLISTAQFCTLLNYFKYDNVTTQNLSKQFSFSIDKGEIQNNGDQIRFDLWRQIFLDRNL